MRRARLRPSSSFGSRTESRQASAPLSVAGQLELAKRMRGPHAVDFRQLEAFATVVSTGSMTAAARVLGTSQPTIIRLV
ncbi:LysR family transcriptional regulator [Aliiruegeria lutimaris]|uniref:Regulatory helix-turn-helix protein, lysR family n=1 Tax=Aliiruegeria lutimaris TaxID=571298 RepID=A0A1G9I4K5_9RHOB|nr:regulatory helix-turn-helix protein, lysR family [Aliiruegeria lutimaris]